MSIADAAIREIELIAVRFAVSELEKLAKISSGDPEAAHADADDILCELLKTLGHEDVVKAWQSVEKWYA